MWCASQITPATDDVDARQSMLVWSLVGGAYTDIIAEHIERRGSPVIGGEHGIASHEARSEVIICVVQPSGLTTLESSVVTLIRAPRMSGGKLYPAPFSTHLIATRLVTGRSTRRGGDHKPPRLPR